MDIHAILTKFACGVFREVGRRRAALNDLAGEVPTSDIARGSLEGAGITVIELLVTAGLASSKSDSRRAVESGGVYLNSTKVDGVAKAATKADLLFGKYLLIRKGKRSYAVVRAK